MILKSCRRPNKEREREKCKNGDEIEARWQTIRTARLALTIATSVVTVSCGPVSDNIVVPRQRQVMKCSAVKCRAGCR